MTQYEPETARGYKEPFAVQFSIFLANRVGQLKDLLDILAEEEFDVLGVSIVDSADWAVIRTIISDPNKAKEVLKAHSFSFTESEVLLVEMPSGDVLSEVCGILLGAEINVHSAYSLTANHQGCPVMALHVDDHILAVHTLIKHGFTLLGHEDLPG